MTVIVVAGVALTLAAAVVGLAVSFGAWGVGYCGSLTPDDPAPGTLRSDLCRGTSGDVVGGAVAIAWAVSVAAPIVATVWAARRRNLLTLVFAGIVSTALLTVIGVLAAVLPR